jgi:hypothetical protein
MPGEYDIDFRERPECYQYRSGEQGVFKVQPYKDELLPLWAYKNEEAARESAAALWEKYDAYRTEKDFVGMDMARKYLQMGFTRAMRYAKYPGGRKYDDDGTERDPQQWADPEKRAAAVVFRDRWQAVLDDPAYERMKARHQERYAESDCDAMESG